MRRCHGRAHGDRNDTATERLSSYNPATGDLIGSVPIHGAAEVDAAVARARVAAERWGALSFEARGEELTAFRKALAAHADDIADLLHRENGKPELEALTEVMMALGHIQHATACAEAAMAPRRGVGRACSRTSAPRSATTRSAWSA